MGVGGPLGGLRSPVGEEQPRAESDAGHGRQRARTEMRERERNLQRQARTERELRERERNGQLQAQTGMRPCGREEANGRPVWMLTAS